jgi:hypothetical protein
MQRPQRQHLSGYHGDGSFSVYPLFLWLKGLRLRVRVNLDSEALVTNTVIAIDYCTTL